MATSNSSTNHLTDFNGTEPTYTAGFCVETEAGSEIRRLKGGFSHAAAISFAEDAADMADSEGAKVLYVSVYRDRD
jgi:hypothetical protein